MEIRIYRAIGEIVINGDLSGAAARTGEVNKK